MTRICLFILSVLFSSALSEQWDSVMHKSTWVPYQILYQNVVLISPMAVLKDMEKTDCIKNPFDQGYVLPLTVYFWTPDYIEDIAKSIIKEKHMNVTRAYPLRVEVLRLVVRDSDFVNMTYKLSSGWVPVNGFMPLTHTFYLSGLREPLTNETCASLVENFNVPNNHFNNFFTLELRLEEPLTVSVSETRNNVRFITYADLLNTHIVRRSLDEASYPFIIRYDFAHRWATEVLDRSSVGVVLNSLQRHELIAELMAHICRVKTTPKIFWKAAFTLEAQSEKIYPPVRDAASNAVNELYCEVDESFMKKRVIVKYKPDQSFKKDRFYTLKRML